MTPSIVACDEHVEKSARSTLNCDEQYIARRTRSGRKVFQRAPGSGCSSWRRDPGWIDTASLCPIDALCLPAQSHLRLAHLNTASCATFFRRSLLDRGFYFDSQWKAIGDLVWVESLLRGGCGCAPCIGRWLFSHSQERTLALLLSRSRKQRAGEARQHSDGRGRPPRWFFIASEKPSAGPIDTGASTSPFIPMNFFRSASGESPKMWDSGGLTHKNHDTFFLRTSFAGRIREDFQKFLTPLIFIHVRFQPKPAFTSHLPAAFVISVQLRNLISELVCIAWRVQ